MIVRRLLVLVAALASASCGSPVSSPSGGESSGDDGPSGTGGHAPGSGGHSGLPDGACRARSACTQGTTERRACGACDTGVEERHCEDTCTFEPWGPCIGEDTGLPFEPATGAPVCGPYDRPAVFFSPHPDDETLGMAGAIREHIELGRAVFIELMTHGEASVVRRVLADGQGDTWHSGEHEYPMTEAAFGDARVREFMRAAVSLGVTGVHISSFGNGKLTPADVKTRIDYWVSRGGPGLSLKGTAGEQDPREPEGKPHPDHDAVWRALVASGVRDVRGYCVYGYTSGKSAPDWIRDITPWCDAKREALRSYRDWAPAIGRFAIGYHSVPELFDTAASRCEELVVEPRGR